MYYHISKKWTEDFYMLLPFIPKYLKSPSSLDVVEERTTPRVCVSDNIGKCLLAMGSFSYTFDIIENDPITHYEEGLMDAYTGKWGVPVRVYAIESEPCVSNAKIVQEELVFDAKNTGEAWFLKPIRPTCSRLFFVTDFKFDENNDVQYEGYFFENEKRIVEVMYFENFKESFEGTDKAIDEIIDLYLEDKKTWNEYEEPVLQSDGSSYQTSNLIATENPF